MIQRPYRNGRRHRVLVVDDDPTVATVFAEVLDGDQFEVRGAGVASDGLRKIEDWHPDLVVLDQLLPDRTGLELLPEITAIDRHLPILFMTATQSPDTAIEAMKRGAFDYATKPVPLDRLSHQVAQGIENRRLLRTPVIMEGSEGDPQEADHLVGRCAAMQRIYKSIGQLAAYDIPALIQGETGTGKKLTARAIHAHGRRAQQPLRTLRCGDYSGEALERELFGCAETGHGGLLECCHGGTLILEEIAEIPAMVQSSLLLHMRDQARISRNAGHQGAPFDVTLFFTTVHEIEDLVSSKRVRSDLFYELSGSILSLPPIRDREQDVRLLVEHYVQELLSIRSSRPESAPRISDAAVEIIASYPWPGNISELKSVLRRSLMESRGTVLASEYLRSVLAEPDRAHSDASPSPASNLAIPAEAPSPPSETPSGDAPLPQLDESTYWKSLVASHATSGAGTLYGDAISQLEKGLLSATLESTRGNLAQAARILGMTRVSLRKKIQKLQLSIPGRVSTE